VLWVSGGGLMSRRYRAPTANGAVLAEPNFDAIPALVEANQRVLDRADVMVGGLSLRELRALARREVLELARENTESPARRAGLSFDGPLLLAGHQPELSHPGVWVKNFALHGLARKLGGIPLHLVVDNDTLKSTSLRFPVFRDRDPSSVHLESLAFDIMGNEEPYEHRAVNDEEQFRTFAESAAPLFANWGYRPLLAKYWTVGKNVGEAFTAMRRACERAWGCHNLELPVSRLSQTNAFRAFAKHVLANLPRFCDVYNTAISAYRETNGVRSLNHPAPELADGEAPFWERTASGRRVRATAASDPNELRPRALTLTLFARVCLGDFFIHGIGGGKYDEVTDTIIRDYFGIEPPAYQVLSATLHLPLPAFPSSADDLKRAERRLRDLRWNPQHCLRPEQLTDPKVKALLDAHAALAPNEPPYANHAARRERFRALQHIKDQLRALVANQIPEAEAELRRVRSEVDANAILRRRDYAWVLYPEEVLRPLMLAALAVRV
jgi:hypothetical protein